LGDRAPGRPVSIHRKHRDRRKIRFYVADRQNTACRCSIRTAHLNRNGGWTSMSLCITGPLRLFLVGSVAKCIKLDLNGKVLVNSETRRLPVVRLSPCADVSDEKTCIWPGVQYRFDKVCCNKSRYSLNQESASGSATAARSIRTGTLRQRR